MPSISLKIKNYFNRPYSYYYGNWDRLLLILITVAILSFFFSYFFEPFEVNSTEHKISYIWICLLHAFVPSIIGFAYFTVLDKSQTNTPKWTLGKEALHLCVLLLLIGLVSFLMRDIIYENSNNWSLRYFWEEIRNTFMVGVLLLAILLPLNLERLFKKYNTAANQINIVQPNRTSSKTEVVIIKTPIVSETFELDLPGFLFAKADGNYLEIYRQENDNIAKTVIRLSLKELKKQLLSFSYIFESHRSYLINTNRISKVSGNAQGYVILFERCTIEAPVSRSKVAEFNALFSKKK